MAEPPPATGAYEAGLRAAREVVARQTHLVDLVHFERPSDFRKGVLTCLAALDAEIQDLLIRIGHALDDAIDGMEEADDV